MSPGVNQPLYRPLQTISTICTHLNLRSRPVFGPSGHPLHAVAKRKQHKCTFSEKRRKIFRWPEFLPFISKIKAFLQRTKAADSKFGHRFPSDTLADLKSLSTPPESFASRDEKLKINLLLSAVASFTFASHRRPPHRGFAQGSHRTTWGCWGNRAMGKLNSNQNQLIFLCSP